MFLRSPTGKQQRGCFFLSTLILTILVVVVGVGFYAFHFYIQPLLSSARANALGVGMITEAHKEQVGLSDGSYAFDVDRPDGNFKFQAATALKAGNVTQANACWAQGLAIDTNDAEMLIYQEDQRVLASHNPYITLVIGTILTGNPSDIATGRDNLQGAYVAQKEYNDGLKLTGSVLVRLLVANAGSQASYTTRVAQQIEQAAQSDHTIVGVMGWPYSGYVPLAVNVLAPAHIPMVSEAASSDTLTGISFDFFRIVPPNKTQAIAGAKYAERHLGAKRIALFVDPKNSYSASLAKDFGDQFTADGNQIIITENYTVGQAGTLPTQLQQALQAQPDLIYFAGYVKDLGVLMTDLPSSPAIQIMGGDAVYQLGYPSSSRPAWNRVRFTAFAYPDEWDYQNLTRQKPAFFKLYPQDFNPTNKPFTYGYSRPSSDVMLAYDATYTLLQAASRAPETSKGTLTPVILRQRLATITGSQGAIQGVTGQISFGADGDPVNKAIVVLYVDPNGFIKLPVSGGVQGCFLVAACDN